MPFFNDNNKKKIEQIHVSKIRFLSEQDGIPERELKNKFIEYFKKTNNVMKAYLVRVNYIDLNTVSVALCIKTIIDPKYKFIKDIGKIFSCMFGNRENLDIIILNPKQDIEISMNCTPFFESKL